MKEWRLTLTWIAVAAITGFLAWRSVPAPRPFQAFSDEGTPFFPAFTDPLKVGSVEIITFQEATASAAPFKVWLKGGRWVIASHYGYPAEAKDRVSKTASMLVDLKKGAVRSDRAADHAALGVIDPLDESVSSMKGRGKRVTLRGMHEESLADLIIGNAVERKSDVYFVRLPNQKRTYSAKLNADLSSRLEDWMLPDLLSIEEKDLKKIVMDRYRVDEKTGSVTPTASFAVSKPSQEGTWTLEGLTADEEVREGGFLRLAKAVDELRVVGVRPKPANFVKSLKQGGKLRIDLGTLLAIQQKGFFVSGDGRLLSNEGETSVTTWDGVIYTVRFGEIVSGASDQKEQRYVFVTAQADPTAPPSEVTKEKVKQATERFADWFYLIPGDSFRAFQVERAAFVKKTSQEGKKSQ